MSTLDQIVIFIKDLINFRQSGYYYNLATGGGSAKDIHILDMQDLVLDRYVTTQKAVLEERDRISNHRNMLNAVCSALDAFFSMAVLIICAFLLFEHQLPVGTMLLMSSSILRLFGSIGSASASLSTYFKYPQSVRTTYLPTRLTQSRIPTGSCAR